MPDNDFVSLNAGSNFGPGSFLDLGGVPSDSSLLTGGGFNSSALVFDTQTGQMLTPQQAFQIDPTAFISSFGSAPSFDFNFGAGAPGSFSDVIRSGGSSQAALPSPTPADLAQSSRTPVSNQDPTIFGADPKTLSLLAVGGSTLLGLAGVIQKAVQGDDRARQQVQTRLAQASPEEQQAIKLALEQAKASVASQQQVNTLLSQLAAGRLPITPELEASIEQAFSPQLGDVAALAMENARQRGFHGGLMEGPAAAIAGPMLAAQQGQLAQAKLDMASRSIPQAVATLQGLNPSIVDALGGVANLSQRPRLASARQDIQQTRQGSLLDTLGPVSQVLGGVGGVLGGIGAMERKQGGSGGITLTPNAQGGFSISMSGQ